MIVYVAGTMRSATTMTGQLVATSPDAILAGEIKPIVLEPERHEWCDCGRNRADCPFWGAAREQEQHLAPRDAASVWSLRAGAMLAARAALHRPLPAEAVTLTEYLKAVARAAGGRVVVDTSKTPVGVLLWRLAGEQVHVVHCLRAPWDVARVQADPDAGTGLAPQPIVKSVAVWLLYNSLSWLAGRFATSYTVVRYRAVRRAPARTVLRIWSRTGLPPHPDVRPDTDEFDYGESHVLAGNPRRARHGVVRVKPVSGWRSRDDEASL